mgnify:CR=1 FL=1
MLRKVKNIAWLWSLCSPIQYLHSSLIAEKLRLENETRYNCQQMLLSYMLNESFGFDPFEKRIQVITPDTSYIRTLAYRQTEGQPILQAYHSNDGEDITPAYMIEDFSNFNFIVRVPADLSGLETSIKAVVDKYKFAGYDYSIVYI